MWVQFTRKKQHEKRDKTKAKQELTYYGGVVSVVIIVV